MQKVDVYLETDSVYQGKTYRKCGYVLSTFLRSGDEGNISAIIPAHTTRLYSGS